MKYKVLEKTSYSGLFMAVVDNNTGGLAGLHTIINTPPADRFIGAFIYNRPLNSIECYNEIRWTAGPAAKSCFLSNARRWFNENI